MRATFKGEVNSFLAVGCLPADIVVFFRLKQLTQHLTNRRIVVSNQNRLSHLIPWQGRDDWPELSCQDVCHGGREAYHTGNPVVALMSTQSRNVRFFAI